MDKTGIFLEKKKGAALRRRMRDQDFGQETFAVAIRYKSRQMISKWWKGEYWPEKLEATMESVLHLPPAFFARIGIGIPYDEALKNPLSEEGKEADIDDHTLSADEVLQGIGDLITEYLRKRKTREEVEEGRKNYGQITAPIERGAARPRKHSGQN